MANEAGVGCAVLSSDVSDYTFVDKSNPASISGTVTGLRVYARSLDELTLYFAFFTADGNSLTVVPGSRTAITSDLGDAGCKSFYAPGDFTAFSISAGNYLGCFVPGSGVGGIQFYSGASGSGAWYKSGDQTNVSGVSFSYNDTWQVTPGADIEAGSSANNVLSMGFAF